MFKILSSAVFIEKIIAVVLLFYCWLYLVLKIIDLLDTVFMVLRKKDSHITFLHVYHHVIMVFFTWFCIAYTKSFQMVIPAMINEMVHVFLYSYYFLATFPQIKEQLWWKKHLTKFQLAQFVVIFAYIVALCYNDCQISRHTAYIWSFNVCVFFVLFLDFYNKSYTSKSPAVSEQTNHSKLH